MYPHTLAAVLRYEQKQSQVKTPRFKYFLDKKVRIFMF